MSKCKLQIRNASNTDSINVTAGNLIGTVTYIDNVSVGPSLTFSSAPSTFKACGSVKLVISTNNAVWWEGYVPLSITEEVNVDYNEKKVTYQGTPLINSAKSKNFKDCGMLSPFNLICAVTVILILIIIYKYIRNKNRG